MKKIRLDKEAYSQKGQSCLVTICAHQKKPIFNDLTLVKSCEKLLRELISKIDEALKNINCRYTITTTEISESPYRD